MPRKSNTVTIMDWQKLRKGQFCKARVRSVKLQRASNRLHVKLENLDPSQEDRMHEISLPWPRPGNLTCALFIACGIDATVVGTTVDLGQVVNATIGMRYRGLDESGSARFDFEPIAPPPTTKATVSVAGNPEAKPSEREDTAVPLADHEIPF